jgi:hypothetical protein
MSNTSKGEIVDFKSSLSSSSSIVVLDVVMDVALGTLLSATPDAAWNVPLDAIVDEASELVFVCAVRHSWHPLQIVQVHLLPSHGKPARLPL